MPDREVSSDTATKVIDYVRNNSGRHVFRYQVEDRSRDQFDIYEFKGEPLVVYGPTQGSDRHVLCTDKQEAELLGAGIDLKTLTRGPEKDLPGRFGMERG